MPSPLPDYLAKLVQESPANRDKLLAAWDGFTTESRIQILDHLIESGAVPLMALPVARRALADGNAYVRSLAIKCLESTGAPLDWETLASEPSDLVRYSRSSDARRVGKECDRTSRYRCQT